MMHQFSTGASNASFRLSLLSFSDFRKRNLFNSALVISTACSSKGCKNLAQKMIIFSILPFANWPQVFLRDICLWIKNLSCYQHLLSLPWNWGLALLSPTCEKVETVNQGAHFLRLFDFDFSKYWEMWNCQPSCTLHIFTLQYWQLSQAILGDVKSWAQKQMLTWLTSSKHMDLMHWG